MSKRTRTARVTVEAPRPPPAQSGRPKRKACDLNETIDEYDEDVIRAIDAACDAATNGRAKRRALREKEDKGVAATGKGKAKTPITSQDADKENNGSLKQRSAKRKRLQALTPLRERADVASSVNSTQESLPPFTFKIGKTALKARKLEQEKRRLQDGNQQRLDELVAYFGSLDTQQLSFA